MGTIYVLLSFIQNVMTIHSVLQLLLDHRCGKKTQQQFSLHSTESAITVITGEIKNALNKFDTNYSSGRSGQGYCPETSSSRWKMFCNLGELTL